MNATEGSTLGGRYTLTTRVAAGGMGEVWRASDSVLGRTVAVKLLKAGLGEEHGFAERFRAEARHSASLAHHNIAAVHDYGEDEGAAYLVMELVDGPPLSKVIADRAPMPTEEVCDLIRQAATALEAAHRGGLIHRDVKPANILLTLDGTAKLTDFGISRAIGGAAMTRTGEVMGTAQYLAPEQAMGRQATAASDVYSLGIVAYEMLTGRRPFDRDSTVATALAQINDPPPQLPPSVPAPLRELVEACLAKNPAARPPSAAAVARAVSQPMPPPIAQTRPVAQPGPTQPGPQAPPGHPGPPSRPGQQGGQTQTPRAPTQQTRPGQPPEQFRAPEQFHQSGHLHPVQQGEPGRPDARSGGRRRWLAGLGLAVVIAIAGVLIVLNLGDPPPPEPKPTPTPLDTNYSKSLPLLGAPAPGLIVRGTS